MNTNEYVKSLFSDYEKTGKLMDLMEELQSNLDARIGSLVKKGLSEQEAFDKACGELGDISALADELSINKRREVFEEAYLDTKKYLTTGRVVAYVIFGALAFFGAITASFTYFSTAWILDNNLLITATLGTFMPFIVASIAGFTFLGFTQETRTLFPVSKKRAAAYTTATSLISFGLTVIPMAYFSTRFAEKFISEEPFFSLTIPNLLSMTVPPFPSGNFLAVISALGVTITFIFPGVCILAYLILTEKNRKKPWAK